MHILAATWYYIYNSVYMKEKENEDKETDKKMRTKSEQTDKNCSDMSWSQIIDYYLLCGCKLQKVQDTDQSAQNVTKYAKIESTSKYDKTESYKEENTKAETETEAAIEMITVQGVVVFADMNVWVCEGV